MDVARLTAGLHEHIAGLAAAAAAGADPNAQVSTCPEWPLRVLVGHVGQQHRWETSIVKSGPAPAPNPFDADPGEPASWPEWLQAGAAELADAVSAAGESMVWTFIGPRPATFWLRLAVFDAVVHHADVAATTGAPFEVAPDLAAEVINKWLDVLSDPVAATIRPVFNELRGTGQTLQLRPDSDVGWMITRTPEGVRWTRATGEADATLAGPIKDLMLVFSRRAPVDRVTVTGDRDLIDHWLAHSAA